MSSLPQEVLAAVLCLALPRTFTCFRHGMHITRHRRRIGPTTGRHRGVVIAMEWISGAPDDPPRDD